MNRTVSLLVVTIVLIVNQAHARDILIVSGHPDYPPVTWKDNDTIVGVAAEFASIVLTELGVPFEIKSTGPWARVLNNAETGKIDVITSAYVTPERQTYMDYSIPIVEDPVSVFVLKGKAFSFDRWEDLIGKRGSTVIGESYEKEFDQFIEQKLNVERVTKTVLNFKKLEKGRADYAIIGLYTGLAIASIAGYADKIEVLPDNILMTCPH